MPKGWAASPLHAIPTVPAEEGQGTATTPLPPWLRGVPAAVHGEIFRCEAERLRADGLTCEPRSRSRGS